MDREPLIRHFASSTQAAGSGPPRPSISARPLLAQRRLYVACVCLLVLLGFWYGWRITGKSELSDCRNRIPIDLQLLLSNDTRPTTRMRKLDERGVYQPFLTIVLLQRAQHLTPLYEQIHNTLTRDFTHILAPLPAASYHVTLSLILYRSRSERVEQFNQLVSLSQERLERAVYAFQQLSADPPLTWRLTEIVTSGAAVVAVVHPAAAADIDRLDQRMSVARDILGPLYQQQRQWHMSFAYWLPGTTVSEEERQRVATALSRLLEGEDIVVHRPELCILPNVTHCHLVH